MRPRSPRWQGPVFLVNSRLGPLAAAPSGCGREAPHPTRGAPSPEVTGPVCRVPWRGFSRPPRYALPAHLCRFAVRAPAPWLGAFLGGGRRSVRAPSRAHRRPSEWRRGGLPPRPPAGLEGRRWPPDRAPRVPPSLVTGNRRHGNLNPLSIAYAPRPRLRPGSPAADRPGCGTLGHPVGGVRAPLALLVPTFALPAAPPRLPPRLRRRPGRSPTTPPANRRRPRLRRRA